MSKKKKRKADDGGEIAVARATAVSNSNDPEVADKLRQMLGPGQVDEMFRQGLRLAWMMLPPDRRTIDELEKQARRILDRAFKDLREDAEAFGLRK
jgi:hypothetical protein